MVTADPSPQAVASAGFDRPVFDSQQCFRHLMDASAHPGTLYSVGLNPAAPATLSPVTASIALTLCDVDCTLWLCERTEGENRESATWLQFQTGCNVTKTRRKADFAFVQLTETGADALAYIDEFSIGTADYPDQSATIVVTVDSLTGGSQPLTLSGPGIDGKQSFSPLSFTEELADLLIANHSRFPLGLDFIFCDSQSLVFIPRSCHVERGTSSGKEDSEA